MPKRVVFGALVYTRETMRAVALCLTIGREELCGLLAQWERQTVRVPLFAWFDGIDPSVEICSLPWFAFVRQSQPLGGPQSLGPARAAMVAFARQFFHLEKSDAILVIDDDDVYHPRHAELTLEALARSRAGWTGALRIGLQRAPGAVPELVESAGGPGTHATWAMRLSTYDAGGGYPDQRVEDMTLASEIGWHRAEPHPYLTHVRRHHPSNITRVANDRALCRERATIPRRIAPQWADELDVLTRWMDERLFPRAQ